MSIHDILSVQRKYIASHGSIPVSMRKELLQTLQALLTDNQNAINAALYEDLGKSAFEVYLTEVSIVNKEINYFINNVERLAKKRSVPTNLANMPGKSYRLPEALGCVLVIGAWNYPVQLSLLPALSALAAGNSVIIKPSELAPATSQLLETIINPVFDQRYLHVLQGGIDETTALLEQRFDKIFFTGSTSVGKIVYQAAAQHLTPVTLELGGKSPAIVLDDCDIAITAKRLVWAKFLNAGQTCVAPDYVLVHSSIKSPLIAALKKELTKRYPSTPVLSENYTRIINDKQFDRLVGLIDKDKVVHGGTFDAKERIILPTLLHDIDDKHPLMTDEIFGPLLPIISFSAVEDAIQQVQQREKPLSCSVYGSNRAMIDLVLNQCSFGSGTVNDSMMQLANHHLPFGGVGHSGMGDYHGQAGFDCFSHYKSILERPAFFEPNIKYAPYARWKQKILGFLM